VFGFNGLRKIKPELRKTLRNLFAESSISHQDSSSLGLEIPAGRGMRELKRLALATG
jgi:hypothetical protein